MAFVGYTFSILYLASSSVAANALREQAEKGLEQWCHMNIAWHTGSNRNCGVPLGKF